MLSPHTTLSVRLKTLSPCPPSLLPELSDPALSPVYPIHLQLTFGLLGTVNFAHPRPTMELNYGKPSQLHVYAALKGGHIGQSYSHSAEAATNSTIFYQKRREIEILGYRSCNYDHNGAGGPPVNTMKLAVDHHIGLISVSTPPIQRARTLINNEKNKNQVKSKKFKGREWGNRVQEGRAGQEMTEVS